MQAAGLHPTLALLGKILGWLILIGLFVALLWWCYARSDDRRSLVYKWLLSLPGCVGMFFLIRWLNFKVGGGVDYGAAIFGGALTAALGLYFAIIWRRNIAMMVANPIGSLYDGGTQQVDAQAFYSLAEAKRKRGHYAEAIAAIHKQLEKFPHDFTGQMMLAEIQTENLHDLPTAIITVQRICNQPKHTPQNIAYALNTLADWHLKHSADPDAAREALQQIVQRYPDSDLALMAEQRIAHLATREHLTAAHDRPRIALPHGETNIGLMSSSAHLAPPAPDQAARAKELVAHLQTHPHDAEAREQLALIYSDHYHWLDLAAEQLGQLINQPHQPPRNVIRWLNLLADLQIRHDCPYQAVYQTIAQIIERFPQQAAADLARKRLDLLQLEMKAKTTPHSVKLGTYEQNLGLKSGPNRSDR
jgi:outer membrane protein assembly factor BamD (BamD/ComL family)